MGVNHQHATPMDEQDHERWTRHALALADEARNLHEVPVGAVVVQDGEIIGAGLPGIAMGTQSSFPHRGGRHDATDPSHRRPVRSQGA